MTRAKNILGAAKNDEPIIFLALYAMKNAACGLALEKALSRKRRENDRTVILSAFQRFGPRRLCKRRGLVGSLPAEASILAGGATEMPVTGRLLVNGL